MNQDAPSSWPPLLERATELSAAARKIIARFRHEMREHLPGETIKLYIPRTDTKQLAEQRAEQRRRIQAALARGEPPAAIAGREQVSVSFVRKLRVRFRMGGTLHP